MSSFVIADGPTPLLNTPDFPGIFGPGPLPIDNKGILRSVEMVALPGTKFQVVKKIAPFSLEVKTTEYLNGPLYLDERFVRRSKANAPERTQLLPSAQAILAKLNQSVGLPYIWGGNWGKGIPKIATLYGGEAIPARILEGVDCSGLLYEATNGFTPRNTVDLLEFGERVEHLGDLKTLDLIVWPGHVLIALGSTMVIESALGRGVIIAPLKKRLPNHNYVIRRFINN